MPLSINDGIQNNSPKPLDNKYGVFASGSFRPYTSTTEANTTIGAAFRSIGQTVLINGGGGNVEYWYQAGTADGNLVPKSNAVSATSPLNFSSGTVSIQQASTSQAGYLSSADWNTFNSKINSVASVGSGVIAIYAGTTAGAVTIKSLSFSGSISAVDSTGVITITGTNYAGVNLGSGSQLYTTLSGGNLQFRSIIGTGGIAATQNTNDITLSLTGTATPTPTSTVTATPTVVATQVIPDASAGILIVTMVGVVSGSVSSCTMAQRFVRYYKTGGVLTILDGVFDLIPESTNTFTSTSWTIVVNGSNNFDVQVTGQTSSTIKWAPTLQNYINS